MRRSNSHRLSGCRGFVRREDYYVTAQGFVQAGERHFSALVQRLEECLELRQIRVVRYVAGVEHLHRKLAPLVLVQAWELVRVKLIVQQASFTTDQVRVKVVRLKAIHDCRAFPDGTVLEFQNRDAGCSVFVWLEDLALRFRVVAGHFGDIVAQTKEQSVERVTTCGQQRAAPGVPPRVPTKLP